MRSAVDPAMIETGLTEYKCDAMVMAGVVHNRSPTASNMLGSGEPPFSTPGWAERIQDLVPFGNPCVFKQETVRKGDSSAFNGRVIGFGIDTPAYRVLLDSPKGEVVASINVTPRRNGQAYTLGADGTGQLVAKDSEELSGARFFEPLSSPAEARAIDNGVPLRTVPAV